MVFSGHCLWIQRPSFLSCGERHKDQQEEASSDVSESPPGLDGDFLFTAWSMDEIGMNYILKWFNQ